MCTDGVSPYKRSTFSFWPVGLTCLNLPPWARLKVPTSHICMVVPGHYNNMAAYLDILIDELVYTYYFGCTLDNSVKCMLLQYQADHKAMVLVQNIADVGARVGACGKCDIEGQPGPGLQPENLGGTKTASKAKATSSNSDQSRNPSQRQTSLPTNSRSTKRRREKQHETALKKARLADESGTSSTRKNTIYPNWRFCGTAGIRLKASRLNPRFSISGENVPFNINEQPKMKTGAMMRTLAYEADEATLKLGSLKHKDHPMRLTGVKGSNPLQLLPYFDSTLMCNPDPAHTLSNESKAIFKCITGAYTPQQMQTCCAYEANVNKRWLPSVNGVCIPWLLSKDSIKQGINRGKDMVTVGLVPSSLSTIRFWKVFENTGHLKMQEHIVLLGPIGKYLLQGLLPEEQQNALFTYMDNLGRLWSRSLLSSQLSDLRGSVCDSLVGMEVAFPGWELNLNRHNVIHIADACSMIGPTPTFSTFFFERLWARLSRWLKQKVQPEKNMMRSYKAYVSTTAYLSKNVAGPSSKSPFSPTSFLQDEDDELERSVDAVLMPQFMDTSGTPQVFIN